MIFPSNRLTDAKKTGLNQIELQPSYNTKIKRKQLQKTASIQTIKSKELKSGLSSFILPNPETD